MSKEFFVTFEQAEALHELGFNEPCIATISNYFGLHINGTKVPARGAVVDRVYPACLQQQAYLWLYKYISIDVPFIPADPKDTLLDHLISLSAKIKKQKENE